MSRNDNDKIDLSEVVESIRQASDNELRILSQISAKLDNRLSMGEWEQAEPNRPPNARSRRPARRAKQRKGEVEAKLTKRKPNRQAQAPRGDDDKAEAAKVGESFTPSVPAAQSATERAERVAELAPLKQDTSLAVPSVTVNAPAPVIEPALTEKAVKKALSGFDDYWKDEKGRLRRANGSFASKDEAKQYESNAKDTANERAQERQFSVLTKLASGVKSFVDKDNIVTHNDAADTAGVAAGGSWFYAIKEVYDLGGTLTEVIDETKDKMDGAKGLLQSAKSFITGRGSDSDGDVSEDIKGDIGSGIAKGNKNDIKPISRNLDSNGGKPPSIAAKERALKEQEVEILQEQTTAQAAHNEEILSLLDDINTGVRSDGEGGLFSDLASVGDMFDIGGRKKKRGLKTKGPKSVLSSAGSAAKTAATGAAAGGVSMAGKAFKGVSAVAKTAGRAVPFIAPLLAAYEAFDGFTDTAKQKETFDLKEGEEATLGQKTSMAAANVLDLGGLVSGGAGLLGGLLGSMGFEGAKEALSFDVGDMAKGIFSLFGGGDDDKEEATSEAKPEKGTNEGQDIDKVEQVAAITSMNQVADSAKAISDANAQVIDANAALQAKAVESAKMNQSVASLEASNAQQRLSQESGPTVVKLDKSSIDDIAKGVSSANSITVSGGGGSGGTTNNVTNNTKVAASAPATGSIPNNFSDRSLQRQSADLE